MSPLHRFLVLFGFLALSAELPAAEITPIDFSSAGYANNSTPIPAVPGRLEVSPPALAADGALHDATQLLQSALDAIAQLPVQSDGFRGALVLRPGTYKISGQLRIRASGTVLRGHDATLIAAGQDRRTLIDIRGRDDRQLGPALAITDQTAPAGSSQLTLSSLDDLTIGQRILIRRPSTKEWIADIGMDKFPGSFADQRLHWHPDTRDLEWERTITALNPATNQITLDAPITTTLEQRFGGGTVHTVTWPGRLTHIGIEGLTCVSEYDTAQPSDEEHAWIAISLDHVENAWIRDVTARHFVSAAVWLGSGTRAITVQDCRSEAPISENAGWRRFAFYIGGQQTLVQRCTADNAREAFLVGLCSAGPNVFLDCTATNALADSGSIESLASGALFDGLAITGASLTPENIGQRYQGAGIVLANTTYWNCTLGESPSLFEAYQKPFSLFLEQLEANNKPTAKLRERIPLPSDSAPITNYQLQTTASSRLASSALTPPSTGHWSLINGHFTRDNVAVFATSSSNAWWKGQTIPARAKTLGWHFARWAPGRIGPGLTEDLAELATRLAAADQRIAQVWPGLWYDRRRDDHKTDTRPDSEVWAPFYEMPWARSGTGTAADGLSKFDLTKFNPWYWNRLRDFTRECSTRGIIVYHHFYNHHNLVEAAAHWADFPWRPANCLQETGFAEPPPFKNNGSRIGIVADFYDVSNPVRRELHRAYIFQGLDVLADEPNVIHTAAFQFAGPLTFQQFFIDTVADWEKARGKKARLALNTSKSITDAILADAPRAAHIDAIDQRYWQYLPDGTLFAPHTDGEKAFREDRTAAFGKDLIPHGTPELVYKQIREYRDRFPEKLVLTHHAGQGPIPILMAGAYPLLNDFSAAQPLKIDRDDRALFSFLRENFTDALPSLRPSDNISPNASALTDETAHTVILYSPSGETIALNRPLFPRARLALWFNPATGQTQLATLDANPQMRKPTSAPWLLFVR
ncbi:hypothetical protein CMV30_08920 [Nibricoccus aquaticus]|uniref:DUF6298 domain-containing protein n=1 Tax=Nibricoccus aquaticus TaxID=2576891 RepID=A0A290Q6L2_9BACT|nr:DUF6298 domain-containing protein [Nibricoccus aquaticus]ATC64063.1 hypothetical protein CMV30_08920 [Nibricoccus aquaticus]